MPCPCSCSTEKKWCMARDGAVEMMRINPRVGMI